MNGSEQKYHEKPLQLKSESGLENVYYPILYEGLPEEAKLYAQQELNETEENKAKGIRILKKYMKKEHLTCTDETMLMLVLRNCKYDFKKSEVKLKRFLKVRQVIINKISQMDTDTISLILDEVIFGLLPYRDSHGRIIIYTQPSQSIDKYKPEDIAMCGLACLLLGLSFPMSSIYGFVYLGECQTPHLSICYPIFKLLKLVVPLATDLPVRIARLDLFNETFLCRWIHNMLRPFLPDKVNKRVMFHGPGYDYVHKMYDPDILPYELGGTLDPLSNKLYKERLLKFIKELRDESCYQKLF